MNIEISHKICRMFNIPFKYMVGSSFLGFISYCELIPVDFCKASNLKKLIQIINKHKRTHKVSYDGDTSKFLKSVIKMRLTKEVKDNIMNDIRQERWEY